jgi:hypothetical protein
MHIVGKQFDDGTAGQGIGHLSKRICGNENRQTHEKTISLHKQILEPFRFFYAYFNPVASIKKAFLSYQAAGLLKLVQFVSKPRLIFLHFARKTFNPWAGLKTDSRSSARDAGRLVVVKN